MLNPSGKNDSGDGLATNSFFKKEEIGGIFEILEACNLALSTAKAEARTDQRDDGATRGMSSLVQYSTKRRQVLQSYTTETWF